MHRAGIDTGQRKQVLAFLAKVPIKARMALVKQFVRLGRDERIRLLAIAEEKGDQMLRQIEEIAELNTKTRGIWKASFNLRFAMMDERQKRRYFGGTKSDSEMPEKVVGRKKRNAVYSWQGQQLPTSFDVRQQWPECATVVNEIMGA